MVYMSWSHGSHHYAVTLRTDFMSIFCPPTNFLPIFYFVRHFLTIAAKAIIVSLKNMTINQDQ